MQGEPTYTVDWFQLGILDVVVGPVLLFSIYYLIKSKKWIENSMIYIVSFCVITFIVAYPFKSGWVLPVNIETGILSYFCNNIESSTGIIYYAAAISIIIFLISSIFFKIKSNGVKLNTVLLMCSILVFLAGTIKINTGIVTDIVVKNQKEHREYHRIAKILNNISNDVYFIESVGSLKDSMFIMQMLANNKEIHWINNENRNEIEKIVNIKNNKDNAIFLLPTPYYNWEEMFSGYQMGYLTDNVALWFTGDNRTQKEIDQIVTDKEIKVPKVNGGKNSVYGEQIMLSPGTYTARYYIKMIKNNQKAESGRLAVVNNEEILQSKTLDNLNSGDEAKIELSFTSDKVLDNIGFQVRQGKDSKIKVQKVTYQKKNSNYTIGLNNAEEMNEVLSVIDLVDSSISQNGSIVFLDNIGDSQNNYNIRYLKKYFTNNKIDILDKVENIPDSIDYIICNNERNIYYSLLKNYTILCMNKKYILLAKDGSMQSKQMEKIQGFKWSKKNNLDIRLFLELNNDGSYDINAPIELEGGNYNYIAELTLEDNALQKDMLGIVSLTNGSHELNSVSLRASQFNNHNKCQISIPLMYMNTVRGLQMNLTLEQGVKVRAVPCYIQLRQKNYALGLEEKSIKQFANIINKSNSRAKVKFVTTKEVKEHDTVSFDYLESLMPKCEFENSIYEEVMNEKGDLFLITYGYSQKFFKMVSEYTIIANSGKYMLWTKSDGSYLVEAMKNGGVLYSQGNKISPYCIAKAQNREFDGTVEQLFTGKYRFYLNIKIDEVKKNDIVEVAMSRKKKKMK